jgi:membrane protein YqaA with SNARE-associated domain
MNMRKRYLKKLLFFLLIFLVVIFFAATFLIIDPEQLIDILGVRNSYFIVFVIAFLGGFSAWLSLSYILTLITFSAGGLNPFFLGFIAGIALASGDLIMFFLGIKGRELIEGKWEKKLEKIAGWIKNKKRLMKFIPFLTYIYFGLTPFPNDILVIFLALIEYKPKKIYIPLILGDLTFSVGLCFLASKGMLFF